MVFILRMCIFCSLFILQRCLICNGVCFATVFVFKQCLFLSSVCFGAVFVLPQYLFCRGVCFPMIFSSMIVFVYLAVVVSFSSWFHTLRFVLGLIGTPWSLRIIGVCLIAYF